MVRLNLSPCRQPVFYLTLSLVAGILVDRWTQPPGWIGASIAAASVILAIRFVGSREALSAGIVICIAFFSIGILVARSERTCVSESALNRLYESGVIQPDVPVELIGTLARLPEPAPDAFYLDLAAEGIRVKADVTPASGHILLLIPVPGEESVREFERLDLKYGSRLRVLVRLEQARSYKNPGSPDFNDFLESKGYQLKGTVKSLLLIERLGDAPANRVLASLFSFRIWLIRAIDAGVGPRLAGILKAMLVDNRHYLDRESTERLRQAGTFHVISISGMHVGIIAVLLLGGRPGRKARNRVWVFLVMLALWAYATVVGLAPPVTRATVMISVGLVGPLLFRRAASLNTVALAAFLMLALKPSLVAEPGFQLSFVAVGGIVGLALPMADTLRNIGEWRPSSSAPRPPSCSRCLRWLAETLFWDERAFRDEMRQAPVSFRLEKARAALLLGRLRAQRPVRVVALLIVTSAVIQFSTAPLTIVYFNRVAPIGVLLNIVAGLLTAVLMSAGTLAVATGAVAGWLGGVFESLAVAAHLLLVNSIVPFADLPGATFRVAHYEGWQAVIYGVYYVPLTMAAVLLDRWSPLARRKSIPPAQSQGSTATSVGRSFTRPQFSGRRRLLVLQSCVIAIVIAMIAILRPMPPSPTGKLEVHFLDVGQGDSALIVFPLGSTMLVDGGGELDFRGQSEPKQPGGPETQSLEVDTEETESSLGDTSFGIGESVVSRYLWSTGRTTVDYLLATHAHADHILGLFEVADNFRVGETIVGCSPAENTELDRLRRRTVRRGVPMASVGAGERFDLEGVEIQVLWPPRASPGRASSANNDSIVLRLVHGSVAILLAGDIEQASEEVLVRSGVDLRADVLKVPHHGSRTSSTDLFIDAVKPRFAVVSVGERSRFGHPHPDVVRRYLDRRLNLLQTGRDGMVTVASDGATIDVRSYGR
jgi:competence protein ComEC